MGSKMHNINSKLSLLAFAGLMAYSQSGFSAPQLLCKGSPCKASDNYFAALGEYFAKGSQPFPEASKGWFSGRCYQDFDKSTAVGGLLVIDSNEIGNDSLSFIPFGNSKFKHGSIFLFRRSSSACS